MEHGGWRIRAGEQAQGGGAPTQGVAGGLGILRSGAAEMSPRPTPVTARPVSSGLRELEAQGGSGAARAYAERIAWALRVRFSKKWKSVLEVWLGLWCAQSVGKGR